MTTTQKTTRKRAPKSKALVVVTGDNTLRSVSEIRKDIGKIVHADIGMDTAAHNLAMECLRHAAPTDLGGFGDYTLFAELIGDVKTKGGVQYGRGLRSRRLGLIEWAAKFTPIRINGDGVIGVQSPDAKGFTPWNLDGAEATPFFDLAGEAGRRNQNKPFGIEVMLKRIGSFHSAIDKAVENNALEGDEAVLKSLAKEMSAYFARRSRELGLIDDAGKATQAAA